MKTFGQAFLVWAVLSASPVLAQYKPVEGEAPSAAAALTPEMLKALERAVPVTPELPAGRNAPASHSVRSLSRAALSTSGRAQKQFPAIS